MAGETIDRLNQLLPRLPLKIPALHRTALRDSVHNENPKPYERKPSHEVTLSAVDAKSPSRRLLGLIDQQPLRRVYKYERFLTGLLPAYQKQDQGNGALCKRLGELANERRRLK